MPMKVNWVVFPSGKDFSQQVASVAELDALLDRLAATFPADAPVMVDVIRANGDALAIGIGTPMLYPDADEYEITDSDRELTVLSFVVADGNPPYYNSLTQGPFPGDIVFFYLGQDSEFGGEAAIPSLQGREAVRQFVSGEGLPNNVLWQEV